MMETVSSKLELRICLTFYNFPRFSHFQGSQKCYTDTFMERHSQRWNSSKDLIDGVTQLRISRRVHHRASHLDNRVLNFLLILRIKKNRENPRQSFFETSVSHNTLPRFGTCILSISDPYDDQVVICICDLICRN